MISSAEDVHHVVLQYVRQPPGFCVGSLLPAAVVAAESRAGNHQYLHRLLHGVGLLSDWWLSCRPT